MCVLRLKSLSGNIFYIVRKWAVLCFNSAWSRSSSHRWWTNVLLKERCTRLGSCTAQQWVSLAADGLKSSHRQTRLLPSICDAMRLEEWNTPLIYCIFRLVCSHALAKSLYLLTGIDQRQLWHGLVISDKSVSLFQHHYPDHNCWSCGALRDLVILNKSLPCVFSVWLTCFIFIEKV